MKCKDARHLLPDLIRGDLTETEKAAVEEHLKSCGGCREELSALQKLFDGLSAHEPAPPPDYYWVTLLPRIHQRVEERKQDRAPRWIPRLVLPLAGAGVVVLALIQIFAPGERVSDDPVGQEIGVKSVLQQMDSSELQEVEIAAAGVADNAGFVEDESANDREVLKSLLADGGVQPSLVEFEVTTPELDDEELDVVFAHLEQKRFVH